MSRLVVMLPLLGCPAPGDSADSSPEDTDHGTECANPEVFDIEITAAVEDGRGDPLQGVEVALDDRGYTREILGSGTTGRNGELTFTAVGVTSIEGCWGTLLSYWVVATDSAGTSVDDDMNTELYNAISDGTLKADIRAFPLVIE